MPGAWNAQGIEFETKVGPGRLLVSGLNFAAAVPADDPAAYCLDELICYKASDKSQPPTVIPLEHLQSRLSSKPHQ